MRILLCLILCVYFLFAGAQENVKIVFVDTVHHFGIFSEDAGAQAYDFVFKNAGQIPLFIHEVKSSCGCTTPAYSREPVLPGKMGKITVIFHPEGRPGKFDKSIRVKSSVSSSDLVLKINGEVTPGNDRYPGYRFRIGNLKLKNKSARLDAVHAGESTEGRIAVVNDGNQPLAIQFGNVPAYLALSLEPEILEPGQEGDVVIVCHPAVDSHTGTQTDEVLLNVVSALSASSSVRIATNIQEKGK